jgi:hypothetical protein
MRSSTAQFAMKKRILLSTLVFCCLALAQQKSGTGDAHSMSVVRGTGVRYLRPDDFKVVPARVRSKLNEEGCLIPQDAEQAEPHNVVRGEFARQGQRDWAAFCSVDGKSKLMVVWGGPSKCGGDPFDVGPVSDDTVSKDLDDSNGMPPHGSFWTLSAISHTEVLARLKVLRANAELLKSATHDALARNSIAGGNAVDCTNGQWREFWSAD